MILYMIHGGGGDLSVNTLGGSKSLFCGHSQHRFPQNGHYRVIEGVYISILVNNNIKKSLWWEMYELSHEDHLPTILENMRGLDTNNDMIGKLRKGSIS